MANETLASSVAGIIATEQMAQQAFEANIARYTLLNLVQIDTSLNGANTNTKRYPVWADLGAASGGTEGTAATNTVAITTSTNLTATPTEGVLDVAQITFDSIQQALAVTWEQVQMLVHNGASVEQYRAMLGPYINRLMPRGLQKMESDLIALIAGLSTSSGTTTVDCSVAVLLDAIFKRRKSQGHRPMSECVFVLDEQQKHDVDVELLATGSGSALSNLWTGQAQFGTGREAQKTVSIDGLCGNFLGYPVYTIDSELSLTANAAADVSGLFGAIGPAGVAPDAPALAGKPGAFCLVQRAPLHFNFLPNIGMRAVDLNMRALYIAKETSDKDAVKIITDAP